MASRSDTNQGSNGASANGTGRGGGQRSAPAQSRNRAADAYQAARERTTSAYEAARDRASELTRQASEQMSTYPVAAVVGGFAVGALLAALLPRTEREDRLLGETGRRVTGAAREAMQKGIDAGKDQIEQIRNRAAEKVSEAVTGAVTEAVADVVGSKS